MFKNTFEKIKKDNRGATVIIAIGIAFLAMLVSVSLAYQIQANKQSIVRFKDKNQAKVYAENVMSALITEMGTHEAGYSMNENECEVFAANVLPIRDTTQPGPVPEAQCWVTGRDRGVDASIGDYTITGATTYVSPIPGTGNAGVNCALPKESTTGTPVTPPPVDLNNPCNWGKLSFGNSYTSRVLVPLYYDEGTSTQGEPPVIVNPADDPAMQSLIVRVRTPCIPGTYDEATGNCTRYMLAPGTGDWTRREDPPLVNWNISGDCETGTIKYCSLIPVMGKDDTPWSLMPNNSEIHAGLINTPLMGNNIVLNTDSRGRDVRIDIDKLVFDVPYLIDFLTNSGIWNNPDYIEQTLSRPVLQLSLIAKELINQSDPTQNVPYLEYQIISDKPIANNSDIYYVFVTYNNQGFKIVKSVDQEKNLVDYAVQN